MIENRRAFLHKGAMHKLRGYAYAGLNKTKVRTPEMEKLAAFCRDHLVPLTVSLRDVQDEIAKRKNIEDRP